MRILMSLAVVLIIIGCCVYYRWLSPTRQLEKAAAALTQVRSLRYAMVEELPGRRNEFSGEIVCSPAIFHDVKRQVVTDPASASDETFEFVSVGNLSYTRSPNGGWSRPAAAVAEGASETCRRITVGATVWMLPDFEKLLSKGTIERGSKKTVAGTRCQELKIATERIPDEYEHTTVCVRLDDNLPIEMTIGAKVYTYSDYNQPIEIELPPSVTQAATTN